MHYIRFLKPPRLDGSRGIISKITVTTDLGESFLATDISLNVLLEDQSGNLIGNVKREVLWKGSTGMRALEVVLPPPRNVGNSQVVKLVINPKEVWHSVNHLRVLLDYGSSQETFEQRGRVAAVRSMPIDLSGKNRLPMDMVERVFSAEDTSGSVREVRIWEETGESIARHIWDAGLVFSSYIASVFNQSGIYPSNGSPFQLHNLESRLRSPELKVLELGAGCGVVGITLASFHPSLSHLVLTDLPEASQILTHNINNHIKTLVPATVSSKEDTAPIVATTQRVTHRILDWYLPLPKSIAATPFDLILVADCTYNPDVVPSLVKSLHNLVKGKSREALICVAMKVRHESEMVFFDLMTAKGFAVLENGSVRLPLLGDESQEIEIYVFEFKSGS